MNGQLYKPKNKKVAQAVCCMGYIEMEDSDSIEGWFGLIPNASSNLTITLSEDAVQYHSMKGAALLYASCKSPVALKKTRHLKFVNIQFKPQGLYYLTGIPQTNFPNQIFDLNVVFSRLEYAELLGRIYESKTILGMFEAIEYFLAVRIDPKIFDSRVNYALSLLKTNHEIKISELSDEVCLSSRRLRELFQEKTGFTPSFLRKVERVNKAMNQIKFAKAKSLTHVALNQNYFDQSHFIKDFRMLSGVKPSQYLKHQAKISDFYNFDIRDLNTFTSNIGKS